MIKKKILLQIEKNLRRKNYVGMKLILKSKNIIKFDSSKMV